jgi:hypothetical protein
LIAAYIMRPTDSTNARHLIRTVGLVVDKIILTEGKISVALHNLEIGLATVAYLDRYGTYLLVAASSHHGILAAQYGKPSDFNHVPPAHLKFFHDGQETIQQLVLRARLQVRWDHP